MLWASILFLFIVIITLLSVFDAMEDMVRLFSISVELIFTIPLIPSTAATLRVLLFNTVTLLELLYKSVIALPSLPPTNPSNNVVRLLRS